MSKEQLLIEILRLPLEERRELIAQATDSLSESVPDFAMTPELSAELDRRHADMLAHPERESPWEEVSARLKARKNKRP
jgi:putative addiction module component (TIGR02574 family)